MDGQDIYHILEHLKWLETQKHFGIFELKIQSKHFISTDIISVIEIIMLYVALFHPRCVSIEFTKNEQLSKGNIYYKNSIIPSFNKKMLGDSYVGRFYKTTISLTHFRKIFENNLNKTRLSSIAATDIQMFLDHLQITNNSFIDNVCEIVGEIVTNSLEHSDGDCLMDIKCQKTSIGTFVSLNFISLTNMFIGSEIENLFFKQKTNTFTGYKIVKKAHKYHKHFFDSFYDKNLFSFVCAFQNGVSTRNNTFNVGGTGLTTLIRNLHDKSIANKYMSYVLSGNNSLLLRNEYLKITDRGNISFGDNPDFYRSVPNKKIVIREPKTFPGTIFSINLIIGEK